MKAILKSVSRSFYLTISFLPRPLREPVSLAYLLARATDTIADTATVPAAIRLTTLREFARVIAGELDFNAVAEALQDFAAQQSDPHERTLIENLRECLEWLAKLDPADRDDIRGVLKTIVRGQELDLRRFGDPAAVTSLRTGAELEEYTYLVAGCVGDFWTKLGFRHLTTFASRSPERNDKTWDRLRERPAVDQRPARSRRRTPQRVAAICRPRNWRLRRSRKFSQTGSPRRKKKSPPGSTIVRP